jgi:sugar phosphate isomerase/epimerase
MLSPTTTHRPRGDKEPATVSPITDSLGVQSYCFRNFKDNTRVAQLVRELGLNAIEICGVHADFGNPAAFKDVLKVYSDAGVKVVSIGVQTFKGEDVERKWFECAAAAGARHISAHFTVGTYQKAIPSVTKLCEEFGIRIGIHCHGGYMFGGSPDVIAHLLEIGGPSIGVNIDTAWCMQIGPHAGNPVHWVTDRFKGRIYGVHIKDFTFARDGQWTDVVVGTGNLDLPAFVGALKSTGFDGMCVLEYEGDVNDPVPALKQCVDQVRNADR